MTACRAATPGWCSTAGGRAHRRPGQPQRHARQRTARGRRPPPGVRRCGDAGHRGPGAAHRRPPAPRPAVAGGGTPPPAPRAPRSTAPAARLPPARRLLEAEPLLERLGLEVQRALRYGRPLTVLSLVLPSQGARRDDVEATCAAELGSAEAAGRRDARNLVMLLPQASP